MRHHLNVKAELAAARGMVIFQRAFLIVLHDVLSRHLHHDGCKVIGLLESAIDDNEEILDWYIFEYERLKRG